MPPMEGLAIDRDLLVRVLKDSCAAQYQSWRVLQSAPDGPRRFQTLRYWEEVLAWVKVQWPGDLILLGRRPPP